MAENPAGYINPRVRRTKSHVLAIARDILVSSGLASLTYTLLGERSRVTRQTLYRHWPTREALLADVILTGPDVVFPTPGPDARTVMIEFLTSVRAGLSEPATASALLSVAAHAATDQGSAAALTAITEDRRRALNVLLRMTSVTVGVENYAQIVGPVITQLLIARGHVSDTLIQNTVDSWLLSVGAPRK